MPGETKQDISGWTVDTLHAWTKTVFEERDRRYEQRFAAQEKATEVAIDSSRIAGTKAEAAIEKRLENTNEWRQAVNDRDKEFLPRSEYDRAHIDLEKRLEEYKEGMDKRLTAIASRQDRSEGRGTGLNAGWGYLVGGLGMLAALFMAFKADKPPTVQPTLPLQVAPQQKLIPQ